MERQKCFDRNYKVRWFMITIMLIGTTMVRVTETRVLKTQNIRDNLQGKLSGNANSLRTMDILMNKIFFRPFVRNKKLCGDDLCTKLFLENISRKNISSIVEEEIPNVFRNKSVISESPSGSKLSLRETELKQYPKRIIVRYNQSHNNNNEKHITNIPIPIQDTPDASDLEEDFDINTRDTQSKKSQIVSNKHSYSDKNNKTVIQFPIKHLERLFDLHDIEKNYDVKNRNVKMQDSRLKSMTSVKHDRGVKNFQLQDSRSKTMTSVKHDRRVKNFQLQDSRSKSMTSVKHDRRVRRSYRRLPVIAVRREPSPPVYKQSSKDISNNNNKNISKVPRQTQTQTIASLPHIRPSLNGTIPRATSYSYVSKNRSPVQRYPEKENLRKDPLLATDAYPKKQAIPGAGGIHHHGRYPIRPVSPQIILPTSPIRALNAGRVPPHSQLRLQNVPYFPRAPRTHGARRPPPSRRPASVMNVLSQMIEDVVPMDFQNNRRICQTTDICPYSLTWMENSIMRSIVKLSLL